MKFTKALAAAAAVAAAGSVGIIGAPIAAADPTTTTFGNEARLTDGSVVQGWTISDLKTSSDVIPHRIAGTLWEATATDASIQGSGTPIVSNLNARSASGETYRVLYGVATPQGVNPSTLAEGEKTTGKVYFDVVGPSPDNVVYIAGGQDRLVWVQAPPQLEGITPRSAPPSTEAAEDALADVLDETPEATTPAPGAPLPAGSQGTPIAEGSQGTPLPAGSAGTPAPADNEGAPQPAAVAEAPAPTGSQGTPLPADGPASAAPTTTVVMPPPA